MLKKIRNIIHNLNKIPQLEQKLIDIQNALHHQSVLLGNNHKKTLELAPEKKDLQEHEFKVFSQWGDDGIIQYLISTLSIQNRTFIEFGVENYKESNTRFLLINNNWKGLVLDGSEQNIKEIKNDGIYWSYALKAQQAFVTCENIDRIIADNHIKGEIGLLHIDIDGNDYWVWESLCSISPVIAIVEYNAVFGPHRAITVPYDPQFNRTKAHHSNLYFGASLKALVHLAQKKGYKFIGCNSHGNNAYFVRANKIGRLTTLTPEQGFKPSAFRESRAKDGKLTYLEGEKRLQEIKGMKVINVLTGQTETL